VALEAYKPQSNTPVVQALCAAFGTLGSILAGVAWSKRQAEREANSRWIPVAASSCDRLITLQSSVRSLRYTVSKSCGAAKVNLPELNRDLNRAVRVHLEDLCGANASRLSDIENHLEGALADWERFIKVNCTGSECAEIGSNLVRLRAKLLAQDIMASNGSCGTSSTTPTTPSAPKQVILTVQGVTTRQGRNGTWTLDVIGPGVWSNQLYTFHEEEDGWYVYETADANSFFWRARDRKGSPAGRYERCPVCPDNGIAVISLGAPASREMTPAPEKLVGATVPPTTQNRST
jgi:hypothetical protein